MHDLMAEGTLLGTHAHGGRATVGTRQFPGPRCGGLFLRHLQQAGEVVGGLAQPARSVGDTARLTLDHRRPRTAVVEQGLDPALEGSSVRARRLPPDPLGFLVQQHQAKIRRNQTRPAMPTCRIIRFEAYGMQRKLTIRVEEAVIVRAKAWAKRRGVSLSDAVESVLERLPEQDSQPLSEWTRSLLGIASPERGRAPSDGAIRRAHLDHVAERQR